MEHKKIFNKKAAMGLRPFTLSLVMVILGVYCILMFSFSFITQTNSTSDVLNDQYGIANKTTAMNNSLSGFTDFSNKLKNIMSSATPSPLEYVFLIFYGAFEIPWSFLSFITVGIITVTTTSFSLLSGAVGGATMAFLSIISAVISAGLFVTIVLLILKTIRTGESER